MTPWLTLRLTPHIHESDFVSLDIFQESSAIAASSSLDANTVGPTTTKRSAKTSVLVKNGDTVVLGGMMQETFTNNASQIPILGDIPLLGHLFRFKSVSRQKTNLLIMLTPRIIRDPGQMLETLKQEIRKCRLRPAELYHSIAQLTELTARYQHRLPVFLSFG